jgi:hypothetical protein
MIKREFFRLGLTPPPPTYQRLPPDAMIHASGKPHEN